MTFASIFKSSGWDSNFRLSTTRGGPSALPKFCTSGSNLMIIVWTGLNYGADNIKWGYILTFKVKLTLTVKVNYSTKNRDIKQVVLQLLSKVGGPGLNGSQVIARTNKGLTWHTQATTIAEDQNWLWVKITPECLRGKSQYGDPLKYLPCWWFIITLKPVR